MRVELSLEQIESYHESGFLVIEDLLDHEEVEHLRTILLEAVAKRGDAFLASDYFAEISSAQHRTLNEIETRDRQQPLAAFKKRRPSWVRMFTQHVNLWQTDERVREFSLDFRLGKMVCKLADIDSVRLWHDQTLIKPAWGTLKDWHMDAAAFPFTHPGTCTFWFRDRGRGC
jgi:hypothetical protein